MKRLPAANDDLLKVNFHQDIGLKITPSKHIKERLAEAMRYAQLQQLALVLRHNMAGAENQQTDHGCGMQSLDLS